MGEHQKEMGWRPPVYFAFGAVAALTIVWAWPDWKAYCPSTEEKTICAREWLGALSGWAAAIAAAITLLYLKGQTAIAGSSLKVASDSLEETRRSSERQLRAYLMIENCRLQGWGKGRPEILVKFQNVGATPAYKVSVRHKPFVAINGADANEMLKQLPDFQNVVDLGQTHFSTAAVQLDTQTFQRLRNAFKCPGAQFFVFGEITFRDAFDRGRRVQFCMTLEPGKQLVDGDLSFALFGNLSD